MWRVFIHRSVRRFEKRHPEYRHVVTRAIKLPEGNPYLGERLSGRCRGLWKLRVGQKYLLWSIRVV